MDPASPEPEHRPLLDATVRELLAAAAQRGLPALRYVVRHLTMGASTYGDFRITIERIPESNL